MDEIIILIGKDKVENNKIGDLIRTPVQRQVFGEKQSVWSKTFFQAVAVGMKPEIVLIIWKFDYQGEEYLEYEGIKYKIIKTYEKKDEKLELTCSSDIKKEVNAYGNA